MSTAVLPPVLHIFRAVATAVVPDAAALRPEGWSEVERTVELALQARPQKMRRQLVTFMRALEWLPLFRHGSRLTKMTPARRSAFLSSIQDSSSPLLRKGFWGLRTLIFLGYYTRPEAGDAIGYRAHPGGWGHRRASSEESSTKQTPPAEASRAVALAGHAPRVASPASDVIPSPLAKPVAPPDKTDVELAVTVTPPIAIPEIPEIPVIVPPAPPPTNHTAAQRRNRRGRRR